MMKSHGGIAERGQNMESQRRKGLDQGCSVLARELDPNGGEARVVGVFFTPICYKEDAGEEEPTLEELRQKYPLAYANAAYFDTISLGERNGLRRLLITQY